jgi:hypothetical protein
MTAPRHWLAGLSGGAIVNTNLVASASSWWATLPPELRGMVGALVAGVLAELVAVLRVWVRNRAARSLGVTMPDDATATPATPEPTPATPEEPASSPEPAEGGDRER